MLRKIRGHDKDETSEQFRILRNKELCAVCRSYSDLLLGHLMSWSCGWYGGDKEHTHSFWRSSLKRPLRRPKMRKYDYDER
jgi:hypothetical protein